jgi:hypothetical protein
VVANLRSRPKSGSRVSDLGLQAGFMENWIIVKKSKSISISSRMIEKM